MVTKLCAVGSHEYGLHVVDCVFPTADPNSEDTRPQFPQYVVSTTLCFQLTKLKLKMTFDGPAHPKEQRPAGINGHRPAASIDQCQGGIFKPP